MTRHRSSAITLGTSGLGARTTAGTPEGDAATALARAMLTSGFAAVDTSNVYADGRSEEVLGAALAGLPASRRTAVVTKVDRDPENGAFGRDRVLRSFEESARRLRLDRVPLLHLHDPYTVTLSEATGPGGAIEGLRELRDAGVVEAIGIAAGPVPLVAAYVETGLFDAVLCHNRYTLVDRSAEDLFAAAHGRGMTVFNAAPFGAGILSRGAVPGATYGYRPAPSDLLAWVRRVEAVCADYEVTLPALALHFSLRAPFVDSTVVGVSSVGRLAELAALADTPVPDGIWSAVDALGPAPSPIQDPEIPA